MQGNLLITKVFLFIVFFSICSFDSENEFSEPSEEIIANEVEKVTTTVEVREPENIFEIPYKHTYLEFENCSDYLGSENKVTCISGASIINTFEFNGSITNIEFFDNYLFVVLKNGKIIKFDILNNSSEEVFNISNNVRQRGMENGLLSLAMNPYESEFVVSYVNLDNKLIFELFSYENEVVNHKPVMKLLEIQSENDTHYGGKVIWSEKYKCFLGSIGDLQEANFESRIKSDPLDTSKVRGKIIGLNCDPLNLETAIMSKAEKSPIQNLIATGLRNPWQFLEFKDYLIIFDTGFTQNEELNITKYETNSQIFGWPVFEATKRSEDLDNIDNYSLDIYHWKNGQQSSALEYVYENSIKPSFYYNHNACNSPEYENCDGKSDIYRAAIIGGGLLNSPSSNYNFDIFFADHISQELFSFNLIERQLNIFPIRDLILVNIVKVFDSDLNQIIVGTDTGLLHIIQLP